MAVNKVGANTTQQTKAATPAPKANATAKAAATQVKETKPMPQKNDSVNISKESKSEDSEESSSALNLSAFKDNYSDKSAKDTGSQKGADETKASGEEPKPIVIQGTEGNDDIKLTQNEDGSVVLNMNGEDKTYSAEEAERLLFNLGEGDNTLSAGEGYGYGLNVKAGDGNNTIAGGSGDDSIRLGNGNNIVYGNDGNDSIMAGTGSNILDGGAGDDKIAAGFGNLLNPNAGNNSTNAIMGGEGNDQIFAIGGANNFVDGGEGDDIINTGRGNDIIYSGGGENNVINSGSGNDVVQDGAIGSIKSASSKNPEDIATQGLKGDFTHVSDELKQYYADLGQEIIYDEHPPYENSIPIVERQDSTGKTFYINANMGPDFDRMMAAATEAGEQIQVNSGYRTYAEQKALYEDPAYSAAAPGSEWSNHEQGMALDIGNGDGSGGRNWFTQNAGNFNFESFKDAYGGDHEPWHFNYNGNQV